MSEYIERNELLSKQYESEGHCGLSTMVVDVRDIEDIPAAEVAPIVRGEWVEKEYPDEEDGVKFTMSFFVCNKCGEKKCFNFQRSNYCPNCGARMDLQEADHA